ncbi:hypothetical protein GpartN1_g6729.t1 [Galdieria partita]|uniref:Uncharacterized protein n=1 Tax=Galdieria partita TaxID=83374 RepID=A0A9C7Q1U6_9RHOD|nr:hypothetical protein GpartN1_g6729.t1 [Galdieria partita]
METSQLGDCNQSTDPKIRNISLQDNSIQKVLCDITNLSSEEKKESAFNESKTIEARRDIIMNISNSEETSKCKKRKANNFQKGNENNQDAVQTLTECYREKKIVRIRRKAPKGVANHDAATKGEQEGSKDEANLSRRIQVRYPKTLSPRPNVKTILKYVF